MLDEQFSNMYAIRFKRMQSAPHRPLPQMCVKKQTFLSFAQSIPLIYPEKYEEHNLNIQLINSSRILDRKY